MPGRERLWRCGLHRCEDQRIGKSDERDLDEPRVHESPGGFDRRVVARMLRLRNHAIVDELLSDPRKSRYANRLGEDQQRGGEEKTRLNPKIENEGVRRVGADEIATQGC